MPNLGVLGQLPVWFIRPLVVILGSFVIATIAAGIPAPRSHAAALTKAHAQPATATPSQAAPVSPLSGLASAPSLESAAAGVAMVQAGFQPSGTLAEWQGSEDVAITTASAESPRSGPVTLATVMALANPRGTADGLIPVAFRSRAAADEALKPQIYYVEDGDTLTSIATHFGVSPAQIAAASGITGHENSLSVHQRLVIPAMPGLIYTIQKGDTLDGLARHYSVSPDRIALANGLKDPFVLKTGQTIVIPDAKATSSAPPAAATPTPPAAPMTYTVKKGDDLSRIARTHGVKPAALIAANHLTDPDVVKLGQTLIIPAAGHAAPKPTTASTPAKSKAAPASYTVKPGDSLADIADTFDVNLNSIVKANNLTQPNLLLPGEHLAIPGGNVPAQPAAAPHAAQAVIPAASTPAPTQPPPPPSPTPARASTPAPVARNVTPAPTPTPVPTEAPTPTPAPTQPPAPPHVANRGAQIVELTKKLLGDPYVWAGTSPSGFDCSGLVWYVYREAGAPIPRDIWGQLQSGTRVNQNDLQPGDIVFFANTYEKGLSHDGIYIGGGNFISAANAHDGVRISSLSSPYWSSHYYGATRPW